MRQKRQANNTRTASEHAHTYRVALTRAHRHRRRLGALILPALPAGVDPHPGGGLGIHEAGPSLSSTPLRKPEWRTGWQEPLFAGLGQWPPLPHQSRFLAPLVAPSWASPAPLPAPCPVAKLSLRPCAAVTTRASCSARACRRAARRATPRCRCLAARALSPTSPSHACLVCRASCPSSSSCTTRSSGAMH